MAELTTAVKFNLPIKIVVLRNDTLGEVLFEQRELGFPNYGCDLGPIDFVKFAEACGADGYRCTNGNEATSAIEAALKSPKPALVEAIVSPEEPPAMPAELKL
jgi:pyruvate dehydrogenase (quinone)